MSNSKSQVRRVAASKVGKKKAVKEPKAVGEIHPESGVELISFSVTAVIPTQQYGNIQPKIEVRGHSIKRAREIVMPIMEELYKTYAELPLNGKEPSFYGAVTVTERRVEAPVPLPKAQQSASTPVPSVETTSTPSIATAAPEPVFATVEAPQKPDPVLKAEKAISLATTPDALAMIEEKIKTSDKIPDEYKADLLTLCIGRHSEVIPF